MSHADSGPEQNGSGLKTCVWTPDRAVHLFTWERKVPIAGRGPRAVEWCMPHAAEFYTHSTLSYAPHDLDTVCSGVGVGVYKIRHSDTQAVPAFHCIRMFKGIFSTR